MTHSIEIFFFGRYRPAYFEGETFEETCVNALDAIDDIDSATYATLAQWLADIAKEAKRRAFSGMTIEHGPIGIAWRPRAHDTFLDNVVRDYPPFPGLKYRD